MAARGVLQDPAAARAKAHARLRGTPAAAAAAAASPVLMAAGDISPQPNVASGNDYATAELATLANPDVLVALGDTQYDDGALASFTAPTGYASSWGRLKGRTCAVVGNHEYADPPPGPAGWIDYFQPVCSQPVTHATNPDGTSIPTVYAFTLGTWRIYVLDSQCSHASADVGPSCDRYGPLVTWLRADLQAHQDAATCKLAIYHHPRWVQGARHLSDDLQVKWLWDVFAYWGGDLVLNAHEHAYARFTSMTTSGTADPTFKGPRAFTVGTGGADLAPFARAAHPGTRTRDATHFGLLRLTLNPGSWASQFDRTDGVAADKAAAGCGAN